MMVSIGHNTAAAEKLTTYLETSLDIAFVADDSTVVDPTRASLVGTATPPADEAASAD